MFRAYDARNGNKLWSFDAGLGISAPAITYKVNGKQMVSLLVGYGGGMSSNLTGHGSKTGWGYKTQMRRLITFSLDGKVKVPAQAAKVAVKPLMDDDFKIDEEKAKAGAGVYGGKACVLCHGAGVIAGSMAPDLRASDMVLQENAEMFKSIVHGGALLRNGMPSFPKLKDEDLEALRHYIRQEARKAGGKM
jgi:quinohemoprotein ethanol dehydrogenase